MRISFSVSAMSLSLVLLCGCSTTLETQLEPKPSIDFSLVDPSKVDEVKYAADYAQCVGIANQNQMDAARMATGALGAAAERATFGIIGMRPGKNADRATVLKRCLEGRGYLILR